MTCSICCEAFTKMIRKPVECPSCNYKEACVKCWETYLTSNPNTECMSCHAPWTRDFIDSVFTKAWVSGAYAKFREGVLMDIEKSQLPGSQYLARNYKTAETLTLTLREEVLEKERLKQRLRQIEINRWNQGNRIRRIHASRFESDGLNGEDDEGVVTERRRAFIRACPVDGCRGFLSGALKCGTCETVACGECFGIRDAEHVCDPNDVETAKYIKSESRPCPTCAINISKIDGCDQMFCVQCRTAFSWRTGAIVRGTIHNPHYFEMLRAVAEDGEIPRQPGDECPQEVTDPGRLTAGVFDTLKRRGFHRGNVYSDVMLAQRHICHLYRDSMPSLREHPTTNADLRMKYLLGHLDDATFKRKLVLRENMIERCNTIYTCYEARVSATMDTMHAYIQETIDEKELLKRLSAIDTMYEGFFKKIICRFNCSMERGYTPRLWVADDEATSSIKKQRVE